MKVLVAMSGGVDSSTAILKLKEAGFDCYGVTMKLLPGENKDIADAAAVSERLGIPHSVLALEEKFRRDVICPFIRSYEAGETPNPCIDCNRHLKFGTLLEEAARLGCDAIATGHYARVERDGESGLYCLRKAADPEKDQSYVLWTLTQEQLSRVLFPLGEMTKPEVRAMAEEAGLLNAGRRDSQDICFIPDGDYAAFITGETGKTYPEGDFVTGDGLVLGRHKGLIRYTVGQRRGLGLALPSPLYVSEKRPADNTVVLCPDGALYKDTLTARDVNWISGEWPDVPVRVFAKVRYRHREEPATVYPGADGTCRVVFDEPQRALTPGQSVVFYDGEYVLGGGIIC